LVAAARIVRRRVTGLASFGARSRSADPREVRPIDVARGFSRVLDAVRRGWQRHRPFSLELGRCRSRRRTTRQMCTRDRGNSAGFIRTSYKVTLAVMYLRRDRVPRRDVPSAGLYPAAGVPPQVLAVATPPARAAQYIGVGLRRTPPHVINR